MFACYFDSRPMHRERLAGAWGPGSGGLPGGAAGLQRPSQVAVLTAPKTTAGHTRVTPGCRAEVEVVITALPQAAAGSRAANCRGVGARIGQGTRFAMCARMGSGIG